MALQQLGYLPTDLLITIARMISTPEYLPETEYSQEYRNRLARRRQTTLYNFCLVNRQWYSAGVEELYGTPILWTGNSFERFIRTICPPRMLKNKVPKNLNTMIRCLDLRKLVHHSSNSVTARLLHEASESLTSFYAPRFSFSVNCLASLSKCSDLEFLDLTLLNDSRMSFAQLKKAICKLENLRQLTLPTHMYLLPDCEPDVSWPLSLEELTIGGIIDYDVMSGFIWPDNMKVLTISKCQRLSHSVIQAMQESLQNNDSVMRSLRHLRIEDDSDPLTDYAQDPIDFLWAFHKLEILQIPVKLALYFHLIDFEHNRPALPMMTAVKLTDSSYPDIDLKTDLTWSLEHGPLSRIWFLQLPMSLMRKYKLNDEDIDEIIMKNVDEVEDEELDRWGLPPGLDQAP